MRVAITANGCGPEAAVDSRFLAARFIIIYDTEKKEWSCEQLSVWARQKNHCGKIQVGILKNACVDTLISGAIDPRSFRELRRQGIRIYESPEALVREATEMLTSNCLKALPVADAVDVSRLTGKGLSKHI